MAIEDYFTEKFYIQTKTEALNSFQGHSVTWSRGVSFNGCLRPLSDDRKMVADKMTVFATHKIYCDIIKVVHSNRIVDIYGGIYEIKDIKDPMSQQNHLEILVLETGKNVGDE